MVQLSAQTEQDSLEIVKTSDSTFVMGKSPWGAVLRSAVVPGWGQFYNESYWKIPVIYGVLGYYTYRWIDNNNEYKRYADLYSESGSSAHKRGRDFYRDQRDQFVVYGVIAYLLNLADAYVDAHLFDFDVTPNMFTGNPELNIRVKF